MLGLESVNASLARAVASLARAVASVARAGKECSLENFCTLVLHVLCFNLPKVRIPALPPGFQACCANLYGIPFIIEKMTENRPKSSC